MLNAPLSKLLSDMADLLELSGDNPFRIRAFRRAAETISTHPEDIAALPRVARLAIPNIGKGVADLIEEFQAAGQVKEFQKLAKKFPVGVLDVMRVGGVGPRRAVTLFRELRVDSLAKLQSAVTRGTLKNLEGFGAKLEANIAKSLTLVQNGAQRLLIGQARKIADDVAAYLKKSPAIKQLELAGSARRWRETVGDLDFLCTSTQPEKAIKHFVSFPGIQKVLAAGGTKASIVLASGLQVDFRVVAAESFGAALVYSTGSKAHNVRLRELALKKGLSLNEYGFSKVSDQKAGKTTAGRTEKEVYAKLGMDWVPPELREDRGEIDAALKGKLPKLVEESDVLGDFHNHTDLSDGIHTLEQMSGAALARGWRYFFCGDHSPSLTIASGLPPAVLKKKIAAVRELDGKNGLRVFASSEVDILADGRLDYPDDVLDTLDCVVASVHSRFKQSPEEMTERLCRAIRHRRTHIMGHLSGRRIGKREPYGFDYETVFEQALRNATAFEINGQPERQELDDVHVRRAVDLGIPLAVTTDAHSMADLSFMTTAVHIARRGWVEPRHLLNCLPTEEVLRWLRA